MAGIIDGISRLEHVSNLEITDLSKEEKKMLFHYLKHVDVINGESQRESVRKRLVTTYSPARKYSQCLFVGYCLFIPFLADFPIWIKFYF